MCDDEISDMIQSFGNTSINSRVSEWNPEYKGFTDYCFNENMQELLDVIVCERYIMYNMNNLTDDFMNENIKRMKKYHNTINFEGDVPGIGEAILSVINESGDILAKFIKLVNIDRVIITHMQRYYQRIDLSEYILTI